MKPLRIAYLTACLTAFLLLAASCIVSINSNGFKEATKEERTHFRPFSPADADKPVSYDDSCVLERINAHDLDLLSQTHPVLWVEEFAPWCRGVTCQNIGRFATMERAAGGKAKLILIALAYDLKGLRQRLAHSGIDRMVYVMDTCYSSHFGKDMKQLFNGLKHGQDYKWSNPSDFVLRNDTVVYLRDGRMNEEQFTAVLKTIAEGGPVPAQPDFVKETKR